MSYRFARADDVEGDLSVSTPLADFKLSGGQEYETDDLRVADLLRELPQLKELDASAAEGASQ